MLKPLLRKKISVWDDTKIIAGASGAGNESALDVAKVAVLLVSPDFSCIRFYRQPRTAAAFEGGSKNKEWSFFGSTVSSCL